MTSRFFAGAVIAAAVTLSGACRSAPAPVADGEEAHRHNNRGVALLEQLKYADAERAFREALSEDGSLAMARYNLGLSLLYQQQLDAAAEEAASAVRQLPASPNPRYLQGLVARAQGRNDAAAAHFAAVRAIDGDDAGAAVQLAQIALEEGRHDEVVALLEPIAEAESHHITAAYVLGLALIRSGQRGGEQWLSKVQALRDNGTGVAFGTGYLEQGRYAEALVGRGDEQRAVDRGHPAATFAVTTFAAPPESGDRPAWAQGLGGVATLDADGDGDLDVFAASGVTQHLWRNDGGAFVDVTTAAGIDAAPSGSVAAGAVAADFDNDGRSDLFVLRWGPSSLFRNEGGGRFRDVTREARLPPFPYVPGAAAFADIDHDGDLDLIQAGLADVDATPRSGRPAARSFPGDYATAPWQVLRNNRNGTFTDVTRQTKVDRRGHAVAIVPADFDNRRDVDLLIVYADAPPALLANQRDGSFRDVAPAIGLSGLNGADAVAVADLNHDDWPDLFFGGSEGGTLALSDGRGRLTLSREPSGLTGADAVQVFDYDGDGLHDLLAWNGGAPRLWRRVGRDWQDETAAALPAPQSSAPASPSSVAVADFDRDGDLDLITRGARAVWQWKNSGDARHRAVRIDLRGRVSNALGVGAKVQARAGSLSSRLDLSAATPPVAPADLVIGLGSRPGVDAIRILWPSGIVQAEVPARDAPPIAARVSAMRVDELDRKPSSCPMLFTWNGERFEFITDFLGAGELGAWVAPGTYNQPDPVELVRIPGARLKPTNGRLEIRITNELEEVLFLDRVQLSAIDHPRGVEVFPDEGMTVPPKADRVIAVANIRPPAAVYDAHGHDHRTSVAAIDRAYVDDFALTSIRGYAEPHTLTIDIGVGGADVLLLTGWTDYAFSSDNVAASQAGLHQQPPVLAARTPAGQWRAIDAPIGIPVGRPQTVPVVLAGLLRPGEHELRLTTNLRIYWDHIAVGRLAAEILTPRDTPLERADLRERGYSAVLRPGGRDPETYDYARVISTSPWKAMPGAYTATGNVRALLAAADDRFVIARSGDEVALDFDARAAGDPQPGRDRTWILRAEGYSQEMDLNSARPDALGPLPFRRMTRYPYPSTEQPPFDTGGATRTRRVVRMLPPIVGSLR